MSTLLVDYALAARLEDAQAWRAVYYAEASQVSRAASDGARLTVAGAPIIYGGAGIPVNRAIGVGMHGPVTDEDLDTIEAFYEQRHADTVIDLCPLADPSLISLLTTRGYSIHAWMSMLFMPLPTVPTVHNPTISVTRATQNQADLWLATSAHGFDETDAETDTVADATLRVLTPNFYAINAHCYFAWQGDTAVGTGGMYLHEGVVELGGASTLVAHRRQGVQTALIQQRLSDAHALGCDLAIVLTTPGSTSEHNMQRRGFQLAYTRAICVRPYAG